MGSSDCKLLIEMEKKNSTTENFEFGFGRFLDLLQYKYRFKYVDTISEDDLNWCDTYIAVRPNTPLSYSIAKAIKESGRSYIVYFDDDLINRKDSIKWRNQSSKQCLDLSDAVFGANPSLCEDYGKNSKHHFSIDTAVDESELSYPLRETGVVQFVYAAGRDHAEIFESIINPILRRFLDEYHEKVHFTFIGVEPRINEIGYTQNFSYVPLMPLERYNEYMKKHAYDVGLAPLCNDRFSGMKYFNKYIEYGKSAIAGLYSDMKPYTYAVIDGENGYLLKNTAEAWYGKMKYCVEHIDEVRVIGLNAQKDLKENYAVDHIAENLKNQLDTVITGGRTESIKWKRSVITYRFFYCMDMLGKIVNQMRNRGFSETIKVVKRKVIQLR